jgi:DAK2 domain fusion protein YloV
MTSTPTIHSTAASTAWTGEHLLEALDFATRWLDQHRDRVNALNVYPIPDGDTGTNMALTMHASLDSARRETNTSQVGSVADRFAFGALMGARGNSGVILSQIFRGFAGAIEGKQVMDGPDFAHALAGARDKAYKAVMRPVEGTMLTVIRVAADHAAASASTHADIATVLDDTLAGAREALADTPNLLAILKQAGVVDAGGQGIVHILEALHRYALGDTDIETASTSGQIGSEMDFLDNVAELHGEDPFGYCTNFMVFGDGFDYDAAREKIASMGQSVVAVGDETMLKVHIHTENPGEVLQYALTLGYLDQIKIDNMSLQTQELTSQRASAQGPSPVQTEPNHDWEDGGHGDVHGEIGIIAVAAGQGLGDALRSMGANLIVRGGQTMNPSTEELFQATESLPVEQVIILPNNKNIVMAAQQVADLSSKRVVVIPSRSLPHGLSALSAFNIDASLEENTASMTEAMEGVRAVEITRAVRDVELNGVNVVSGELIGLVDGKLVFSGSDLVTVVVETLESISDMEPELLTVFLGEDATDEATAALEAEAAQVFPDAEIEVIDGHQPHYQYLISVE